MSKIKIRLIIPSVGEDVESLKLSYTGGGNVNSTTTLKSILLPYDKVIPLLDIYAREMKAYFHRKPCTQMLIALFVIAKN